MQKHTKIYMDAMGYDTSDFICCEVCRKYPAVDIHHRIRRGLGGTKKPDTIENLMAMCRKCHVEFGDKKQHMDYLKEIHALRMKERGVKID